MWKRLDSTGEWPRAGKFVPVAVESRGSFITCTALWTVSPEGDTVWFGLDGKRITAAVAAWYEVPVYFFDEASGD